MINEIGNNNIWNLNGVNAAQSVGANQNVQQTSNEDQAIIEMSNGNQEVAVEDIEAEYAEALAALGNTEETSEVTEGEESAKIKEEIEELQEEKEKNEKKMEELEAHIEDLAEEAENLIYQAALAQEAAIEQYEDDAKAALNENINAYIAANKAGGEGMTKDELQNNLKNSMPNAPHVADIIAALTEASELVAEIDSCLGDLNKLISDTQNINNEIDLKQGQYEAALAAEEAARQASKSNSCDPIGFVATDAEGNEAQYDFIVDDGAFDTTSDFLGAKDQWAEMTALDESGDNKVTADELQKGNIKAVKTNADGTQEIVDIAEEFGEDFSIDLNSYTQGGSHSAVDATADTDGDGTLDQELLGTFNVNANGQTIQGYNTLDDVDYLASNYGIAIDATEEVDTDLNSDITSADLQDDLNFFETYTTKSEMLKEEIEQGFKAYELSEEQIEGIAESTKNAGEAKAAEFAATLEETEEEEAEEAEATEETTVENAEDGITASQPAVNPEVEEDNTVDTEKLDEKLEKVLEANEAAVA